VTRDRAALVIGMLMLALIVALGLVWMATP
jgi:hypothetical protein